MNIDYKAINIWLKTTFLRLQNYVLSKKVAFCLHCRIQMDSGPKESDILWSNTPTMIYIVAIDIQAQGRRNINNNDHFNQFD